MTPYRIILADGQLMFRQGMRQLIKEMEDVQIIGEACDGLELLELLKTEVPDLIILEISLPKLPGLVALQQVKRHHRQLRILILSMHRNKELVKQALNEGADGYILKEESYLELLQAITALKTGHTYFSSRLSEALLSVTKEEAQSEVLTCREKEVLNHLARGLSMREIADSLFISVHTVRRHRYNIMQKLNLHSMTDLIKYAIAHEARRTGTSTSPENDPAVSARTS